MRTGIFKRAKYDNTGISEVEAEGAAVDSASGIVYCWASSATALLGASEGKAESLLWSQLREFLTAEVAQLDASEGEAEGAAVDSAAGARAPGSAAQCMLLTAAGAGVGLVVYITVDWSLKWFKSF